MWAGPLEACGGDRSRLLGLHTGEVAPMALVGPAALRLSSRAWMRCTQPPLAVEWLKRNRCGRSPWSTANPRTRHSGTASIAPRSVGGRGAAFACPPTLHRREARTPPPRLVQPVSISGLSLSGRWTPEVEAWETPG